MELRVLTYFLTVAREKTISKAAEVLHLSQPTLSKQLKELEEELGVTLFTRGNRFITLTEDGIYLMNRGKEILSLVDSTMTNLTKNEVISGQITIGGGETQAFEFLSHILHELRDNYPEINIHLYSGNADDVLEKIDKGLLDFGLVIDPVEKQKYEYIRLPLIDSWGILVNNSHPLAKKKTVQPKDIQRMPLLISNQSFVDNQLSEWFGGNIEHLNVIGTYNLLYNASLLAKENIASVLCIDGIVNTTNTTLIFIPFSPPLTANISIVWKKGQIFSSASKEFLRLLKLV
ncbi:LysR family transcriptional regulator [Enterococcus sp. 7E2_DIV0204]|uniref:LysR family transcriptional regulator n=1 Tax=unclassified Enterococcus TaxID=2608891 RepID=UPI000A34E588|nr:MULTISPECIES: LysR family transcriptional regulator [unclassified Enterococcus]OTN86530.1 LysR family transcriptional regulator [Enterococcus sp. 7E2_DIV0204]OTP47682.1 LysR family transcriptional regulator [Enterococcus sp. 7D2_DIV0200]